MELVRITLVSLCVTLLGCSPEPASVLDPSDVEMIFWERQSWEVGGGRSRLTIWADGRSEVQVVPDASLQGKPEMLRPRAGWLMRNTKMGLYFIRKNPFPENVAKDKLTRAIAAGIHALESFKPDYLDGSGVLAGVQIAGQLKQTVIPMFLDRHSGSANHKRFLAVSKILADFDTQAYDIKNP